MKLSTKILTGLLGLLTTVSYAAETNRIPSNLIQFSYGSGHITEQTSKAVLDYDVNQYALGFESRFPAFLLGIENKTQGSYHGLFVGIRSEFSYDKYSNFKVSGYALDNQKSLFAYIYKPIYDAILNKVVAPESGFGLGVGLFGTVTYQVQLDKLYADAGFSLGGKAYITKAFNSSSYKATTTGTSPLLYGLHAAVGTEFMQLRVDYQTSRNKKPDNVLEPLTSERFSKVSLVLKY